MGALFFVLAVFFGGIAFTAFQAEEHSVWVIGVASGAITLWMVGLSARSLRRAR